ncbi:MAG: hypothetical protein K6G73_12830 [Marinilabiliaceae bacterium]|nr:hypothetical protein [Marinilabiliaceae bacterium]
MELLIQDIQNRLRTEIPELQTIDEDYGQLNKMFDNSDDADIYPVLSPALFINVSDVAWSDLSCSRQRGIATVVITLAIDCYDDTHMDQNQRQKISERLALERRIHNALHGWKPSEATRLIRTSTRLYHLPHLWKAYETTYTCELIPQ